MEQIRDYIGADSLGYLSVPGIYRAIGEDGGKFCDACFSDNYRLGKPLLDSKAGVVRLNYPRQNNNQRHS